MAQRVMDIASLTADDLPALEADASRCSRMAEWSVETGAAEAASLANAGGGVIIAGPQDGLTEAALLAAGEAMQPHGRRLLSARMLETPGGVMGLLGVRESADPPVLAGDDGAIVGRSQAGSERVRTRAGLDELTGKRQRLRERAERTLDAQAERIAAGHANFYTLALLVTPLLPGSTSLAWARDHRQDVLGTAIARRWELQAQHLVDEGAVTELRRPGDTTGFLSVAGNGTLAIGQRAPRPSLDRFFSPAELSARLDEFAEAARLLASNGGAGLVLPALFLEGLRDLRLEGADGYGPPCTKDVQQTFLTARYLETAEDRDTLSVELREVVGPLFGADLFAGTVQPHGRPVEEEAPLSAWYGKPMRTERRLAGERGFGSAR